MNFSTKQTLANHQSSVHINKNTRIKCNLCDFTAINRETLIKHKRVAMGHKVQEQCKFFIRGQCSKGRNCLFKHEYDDRNLNGMNGRFVNRNPNQFNYQRQCRYRMNCFRFSNCSFKHNEICRFQEQCFKQENCLFVHLNSNPFLGGTYPY